jgi:hypothetical protein
MLATRSLFLSARACDLLFCDYAIRDGNGLGSDRVKRKPTPRKKATGETLDPPLHLRVKTKTRTVTRRVSGGSQAPVGFAIGQCSCLSYFLVQSALDLVSLESPRS